MKRFRRASALASMLLAGTSPLAMAQTPITQRKIPATKQECDQLSADVLALAMEKLGVNGLVDYLKASNIERNLDQLCAEGNYQGAHAIAVAEAQSFLKAPEPSRTPRSTMQAPCAWDGNREGWSASAGAGEYTLAMFVEVNQFDDHALVGRPSRFAIDRPADSPVFRYRLEVPLADNRPLQSVDVELTVGTGEPKRARVPILSRSWADITKLMPQFPEYFATHVAKVFDLNDKLLMTATFVPKRPGSLISDAEKQAQRLKNSYDAGGCAKRQCFLTTACCDLIGLDDTCFELRALRAFRDNALPELPGGKRDVALYYALAPVILDAMRAKGSERELLRYYASHIVPCALLASIGLNAATRTLYRDLMRRLTAAYAPQAASLLDG